MLISFGFLLPFPFTGISLLWLKLVIVPILSLSLLGTPANDQLMNQMTDKRINDIYVGFLVSIPYVLYLTLLPAAFFHTGCMQWRKFKVAIASIDFLCKYIWKI